MAGTRVSKTVGADAARQWHGVYLARVARNRKQDLWVELQVPQVLGTALSNWAPPVGAIIDTPGITPGPGLLPGTIVLAMFVGGDINTPVFLLTSQLLR